MESPLKIWDEANAKLPGQLRVREFFKSNPMVRREDRLKEAKINAERCNRNLKRDRFDLERKEKLILQQVKHYAAKGDLHKARILARQIAHYRSCADRNFESAAMIETRAQLMASNHVINRAEIEAIKGAHYANLEDSIETAASREMKYAQRMGVFEEIERIMNEGMDDVYETAEESRKKRDYFDLETEAILKTAMSPRTSSTGRPYVDDKIDPTNRGSITLHFRVYDPSYSDQLFTSHSQIFERIKGSNDTLHPPGIGRPSGSGKGDIGDSSRTSSQSSDLSLSSLSLTESSTSSDATPNPKSKTNSHHHQQHPQLPRFPKTPSAPIINSGGKRITSAPNLNQQNQSKSTPTLRATSTLTLSNPPSGAGGATLKIATLDFSVDMLKRLMIRDAYLLSQLGLRTSPKTSYDLVMGSSKPFRLGRLVPFSDVDGGQGSRGNLDGGDGTGMVFEAFDFVKSLKECGIRHGSEVLVVIDDEEVPNGVSGNSTPGSRSDVRR
ncbi:hypothetical protein HDU76_005377 [Blyttiomyces sp. JEL0837]|nr:hypothetical protein HDU76_005377 [Blyttiomyces sp. JEL0837]